jgi:phenylacetic acid degradation operon negative regulatory protein
MTRIKTLDTALAATLQVHPPRAGSLIISVFGDSISQHGNSVWLGSLIAALEPFGLNPRQIRTAVFRLVKEGWLSCIKSGRRSYYSFTAFGQRQYEKSARRIYAAEPAPWDGQWTLVVPAFAESEQRDLLKRELSWLGFATLANGVLAHPCANQESLRETIEELDLGDLVVVLRASTDEVLSDAVLKRLMRQSWRLDKLGVRYDKFNTRFRPVLSALRTARAGDTQQQFELQTILIHEYRRILLKTTDLPDQLMPRTWPGRAAMELTGSIYRLVREQAATYLESSFEGPKGLLMRADHTYMQRFV